MLFFPFKTLKGQGRHPSAPHPANPATHSLVTRPLIAASLVTQCSAATHSQLRRCPYQTRACHQRPIVSPGADIT